MDNNEQRPRRIIRRPSRYLSPIDKIRTINETPDSRTNNTSFVEPSKQKHSKQIVPTSSLQPIPTNNTIPPALENYFHSCNFNITKPTSTHSPVQSVADPTTDQLLNQIYSKPYKPLQVSQEEAKTLLSPASIREMLQLRTNTVHQLGNFLTDRTVFTNGYGPCDGDKRLYALYLNAVRDVASLVLNNAYYSKWIPGQLDQELKSYKVRLLKKIVAFMSELGQVVNRPREENILCAFPWPITTIFKYHPSTNLYLASAYTLERYLANTKRHMMLLGFVDRAHVNEKNIRKLRFSALISSGFVTTPYGEIFFKNMHYGLNAEKAIYSARLQKKHIEFIKKAESVDFEREIQPDSNFFDLHENLKEMEDYWKEF